MSYARLRGVPCLALLLLAFAGQGCSDAGPYESDTPQAHGSDDMPRSDADAEPRALGAWPRADHVPNTTDTLAVRVIAEADVVQLSGDTLYTLSGVAGLSVIDVGDPAEPVLLGRAPEVSGAPLAMYVRDGVVLALFTRWRQFITQDGDEREVEVSKVVAYDVADPAHVAALGSVDVPGEIGEARVVGDVLYVVGREDEGCWGCALGEDQVSIRSIDVRDPRSPRLRDFQRFQAAAGFGERRSVSLGERHVFVAGPDGGTQAGVRSNVQVIDLSDPSGALALGMQLTVPGKITQPWQLDEYQGVLRVISQADDWAPSQPEPPSVALFRLASARQTTPLAVLPLQLPDGRRLLRGVRFDGTRAYALSDVPGDPLFTLDLSDPAQPRQRASLPLPGSILHLTPRGDRLFGVSLSPGHAEGAVAVSLFDVTDLAAPALLSRVNVGARWTTLAESQIDLHKAFRVVEESGLVLVPLHGSESATGDAAQRCVGANRSAVQLLDLKDDRLSLRATVPSPAEVRRALVHREQLLLVSDANLTAFDLREHAPRVRSTLMLEGYVDRVVPLADGVVARLHQSDWSAASWIDLVRAEDIDVPHRARGALALDEALGAGACAPYRLIEQMFAHDRQLEILYRRFESTLDLRESRELAGVLVVDAADLHAPRLIGKIEWALSDASGSFRWHGESAYARVGDALTALETDTSWFDDGAYRARLRSVDLSHPAQLTTHVTGLTRHDFAAPEAD